ncbi:TRAP transporter large permease [Vreelandella titanicae]|jgi:tripartite ATP-independent transporter DctM subunit|uniref:TRAP transporter large permease protein n=1 Tax=Vreelandella titanicae BH1 TaxID=1204738 RepID=L9UCT7_9GAMM|nr:MULTISPECIES: TRAP transporter large permease [Halomonas]UEQ03905.1 TRAP transporter large permease [Halomonas profundus]ELY22699.1 TRAP dicarboxylate transporter, DctM subunit [Halomonas titanicae BH1]MCD1587100.1 TRAP transporter large permease [Halomonas sp. IOP_14]NVE88954.1 TRAP transporter large permease [Halomonas titanicae]QNU63970.1 TRAP transporter large permease [Halomonas titanicae]
MSWLLLSGALVLFLTSGAILGAALGLTGLLLLHFQANGATPLAINATWNMLTDFTLSAVPLFIFLGEILLASGVSKRVYNGLTPLFARVPGQLLHTNIAVCTLFGAVSGSSTSTAAAIGAVGYPELTKRGYKPSVVVGTLAAGGTLGLLIPPSLALIIYGATQNVSIGQLFIAGMLPGLLIAAAFSTWIMIRSKIGEPVTPTFKEKVTFKHVITGLKEIWPLPVLIFFVLGTIYLGIATPTESAALGVVASIVLGLTWGDLTFKRLWQAFKHASIMFTAIGMILIGTVILSQAVSLLGIPRTAVETIGNFGLGPYGILLMIVIVYIVLGCFFDGISLLLMTLPITFPMITSLGFDPIWFGIIVTLLIEIGMITPPVGLNLFVLSSISKNEVNLTSAAKASLPYWLILLGAIGVFTLFPNIILWVTTF